MKKISKIFFTWFLGGILYVTMEILMRGYSHFSMFICGGFCFSLVGYMGKRVLEQNLGMEKAIVLIMILGTMIITTLELFTGIVVNIILNMEVWDYSDMKYNVLGQICPLFSGLWALISLPCVYINSMVRKYIYGEELDYIRPIENINQT